MTDAKHASALAEFARQSTRVSEFTKFFAGSAAPRTAFWPTHLNVAKSTFGKASEFDWSNRLADLAKQIGGQHATWLKSFRDEKFGWGIYPSNLRDIENLRLAEVRLVALDEGIPLWGVPPADIAAQILRAGFAAARRDILGRKWKLIVGHCRQVVQMCGSPKTQATTRFVNVMVDALEAGHFECAQALGANLLDTILTQYLSDKKVLLVPSRKVRTPDGYEELVIREYIAFAPIWLGYQSFFPDRGDRVPRRFNRHATAHAGFQCSVFKRGTRFKSRCW